MPKRQRCSTEVIDRETKRKRKCKNRKEEGKDTCRAHTKEVEEEVETEILPSWEEGTCCFCGDECNPMSQACGYCMRRMTMRAMGWIT